MSSLLSIKKNMFLRIKNKKSISLYRCLNIENIKISGYLSSSRYYLQSEEDYKQIILEVKKDKQHNILISTYHLIEKINFDISFLSNLGNKIIIYKNMHSHRHEIDTKYEIIQEKEQKESFFKYIISKDDPAYRDYKSEYQEDNYGNIYYILKKISPLKSISDKETRLFWEYKNILNNKLYIEVIPSKKSITFYQNINLRRDHIQLINKDNQTKDYKNYDDLKNKYYNTSS